MSIAVEITALRLALSELASASERLHATEQDRRLEGDGKADVLALERYRAALAQAWRLVA